MADKKARKMVALRLMKDAAARLAQLAAMTGQSQTWVLEQVIMGAVFEASERTWRVRGVK